MNIEDKAYELHILKKVINSYLDKSVPVTEEGLNVLLHKYDELVWEIATKIYTQSGHKAEFSTIRDVIDSRAKILKAYIIAEKAEAEKHLASEKMEVEKHRQKRLIILSTQLEVSGRDNSMSTLFLKIQDIVSEQLSIDVDDVALDRSFRNDLGIDELDFLALMGLFEEEFDIDIPDRVSEDLCTVGQLVDYIYERFKLQD